MESLRPVSLGIRQGVLAHELTLPGPSRTLSQCSLELRSLCHTHAILKYTVLQHGLLDIPPRYVLLRTP